MLHDEIKKSLCTKIFAKENKTDIWTNCAYSQRKKNVVS